MTESGTDPVGYLLSQQRSDGSFTGFDPSFATNQVVPALAGRSFAAAPLTLLDPLQQVGGFRDHADLATGWLVGTAVGLGAVVLLVVAVLVIFRRR